MQIAKPSEKKQTNYAFIDSQNLNLGISNDIYRKKKCIYKGWKLDYLKFYIYLKDKYKISKSFLFIGYIKENQKLYEYLKKTGYILIFKPTVPAYIEGVVKTKGNVDAELVLHTMIEYPHFNKAIIVSGDGDFHCLIDYLNSKNKLGHILVPNRNVYSSLLNKFYKYLRFVNEAKEKLKKAGLLI